MFKVTRYHLKLQLDGSGGKIKGGHMATIFILDDNPATSAFLKIVLTRHWHRVSRIADIKRVTSHSSDSTPELVLINHAYRNHSGWKMFNHMKRTVPHIPAMVYGLDQLNAANADWVVKAVEAAIGETTIHPARHPDSSVLNTLFAG
jgi:DNA-binding NtrC family response regulator